jgi:hypothetical protein
MTWEPGTCMRTPDARHSPRLMARRAAAFLVLYAVCACGRDADTAQSERLPPHESAGADAADLDPVPITQDGIGLATRGLSVGELRDALAPAARLGPLDQAFMVDVSAVAVIAGTDTLYHLLFPSLDVLDDSMRIELVATLNGRARTADGLGPGITLAEAATACGPLTLVYSVYDELREYAVCPSQPANISFRTNPVSDDEMFAGTYSTDAEYNTTTTYDPAARIRMVMVDLR